MAAEDPLSELEQFLDRCTRLDVRVQAVKQVLGLTGSSEGQSIFLKRPSILDKLVELIFDDSKAVARDANLSLVNLTANDNISVELARRGTTKRLIDALLDRDNVFLSHACMSLSNITRTEEGSRSAFMCLSSPDKGAFLQLVVAYCQVESKHGAMMDYVATIFSNLTQLRDARALFLDKSTAMLQRLMPFTHFEGSAVRRRGTVGLLRNLCFESDYHSWLLSDEVDLLPTLLLPLAGPEEVGGDEVMEKLPEDLQYLPDDKQRETEPDIRKMLLETLMQLCATGHGRQVLREKQTYVIIRELHQWEVEPVVAESCQQLIGMLIADEPETGMENLHNVVIPDDIMKDFEDESNIVKDPGNSEVCRQDAEAREPEQPI